MASLGQNFNANDVEPSTQFEVLPAGRYVVQIVQSEMRDTKSGSGQYLSLEMDILDGQYTGRKIFDRLNLVNANEKAVEIAYRTLSAICRATGVLQVSDSEALHFKPMVAVLKVRPAGPDKSGTHREAQNEIGSYEASGGAAQTHSATRPSPTPQPAQATQTAATAWQPGAAPWRRNAA